MKTRGVAALTLAAVFFGATMAYAPAAHAEEVSPKAKGIIGGALLGAELVTVTEALVGVRSPTAFGVGAGLGAVAGGFAGFGVEQANSGSASVIMLAGGIAMIIPALVVTLNATSFQGDPNAKEDRAPTNLPPADPGAAGGSAVTGPAPAAPAPAGGGAAPTTTPAPAAKAPAPAPAVSLLSLSASAVRVGVPVPEAHNVFSAQDRRQLGMAQVTELRLPVVNVTF
ncbi:MAG: hypothetical protein IPF92_14175 [Myxococcales bacterium]|jgi:hypothetical protein|nr:hypothetical protein [Myxococcales bacterium]